jgi:hypothetical protein
VNRNYAITPISAAEILPVGMTTTADGDDDEMVVQGVVGVGARILYLFFEGSLRHTVVPRFPRELLALA